MNAAQRKAMRKATRTLVGVQVRAKEIVLECESPPIDFDEMRSALDRAVIQAEDAVSELAEAIELMCEVAE